MTAVCIIPIKANSSRVELKNFRSLGGRPLYQWALDNVARCNRFDSRWVDTDSDEVARYAERVGLQFLVRKPELALDTANGNDLLVHHAERIPGFDLYFQVFCTAPYLKPSTIDECVRRLEVEGWDSIFTAERVSGWHWFQGQPVNFRPGILPRSQDAKHVYRETTGLYGIKRDALMRYRCRIGATPAMQVVDWIEGMDFDTREDFERGELVAEGVVDELV